MVQIYGSGIGNTENVALVTDQQELLITGSVTAQVTAAASASEYQISGPHTSIGSASLVAGDFNGSVYPLRIVGGSHLLIAGSISSLPPITTSNDSVSENETPHLGSSTLVAGDFAGSNFPLRMDLGSFVLFAGSISSIPSISTTENSVYEVSGLTSDLGSVTLMGGERAGSVWPLKIEGGSHLLIAGSISSIPPITATNESVAEIGTAHLGSATLIGADFNGSIVALLSTAGSELIVTGSVRQGTDPWIVDGSSAITNFGVLGSSRIITAGSVNINNFGVLGSERTISAGSVIITDIQSPTGSMEVFQDTAADFLATVTQDSPVRQISAGSTILLSNEGSIPVFQDTAADLNATVTQASTTRQITAGSTIILSNGGSIPVWNVAGSIQNYDPIGVGSVLGLFTDSSNNLDSPLVEGGSYLLMAGSISSLPPISTSNDSVSENETPHTGSSTLVAGDFAGSNFPLRMDLGSFVLFAGSISSIPSISATNESVAEIGTPHLGSAAVVAMNFNGSTMAMIGTAGSELIVTGSVRQVGAVLGSVFQVSSPGSHEVFGALSATNPSVYAVSGTWDVGGVGSATLIAGNFEGSVYPLHLETGSSLLTIGSTHVINFGEIGSVETQGVSGTAFNTVWVGVGSVVLSGTSIPPSRGIGSVRLVPGSLEAYQAAHDELNLNANLQIADTDVNSTTNPLPISGIVNQGTTPWAVSGNALGVSGTAFETVWVGVGSVQLVPGSLEVFQQTADNLDVNISAFPLFDLGSPGYQQTTYILTSGTYVSEVWTPGTGSRIEIHGWAISSDVPQEVRLSLSGTTPGFSTIARYRLPASGTILKTLVHPITPGAADEGIGLGTTVTGSTDITIYARDKV